MKVCRGGQWLTYTPDGVFPVVCDGAAYADMIGRQGGPAALAQWRALERELAPLQAGAALFPAAALRSDLGALRLGHSSRAALWQRAEVSAGHWLGG